jgi:hypothetical protein
MAIANVRERLALHFDAEGSLDSRVVANAYEVHLRMPYRAASTAEAAPRGAAAAAERPEPAQRDAGTPARLVAHSGGSHG